MENYIGESRAGIPSGCRGIQKDSDVVIQMKARIAGVLLWLVFLIPHLLAPLLVLLRILFCSTQRAKDGLRSMDMTTNCLIFAGSPYESVSSHSWRELGRKGWAKCIVWFTDIIQPGHCASANKVEQPIVDFINRKG